MGLISVFIIVIGTGLAFFIGNQLPLLGNSIAAIIIGSILRHSLAYKYMDDKIISLISSKLLKAGIVFLGFNLSLRVLGEVGLRVLLILTAVAISSLSVSYLLSKKICKDKDVGILIGVGTSICGGSAIVSVAPIIQAEDKEIAVSITTMFIYSILALLILPIIGNFLGLTDQMYGVLAGAAVNDVASVVATSFTWSEEAGQIATVVKLVRTLYIVPVSLAFILKNFKEKSSTKGPVPIKDLVRMIPLFVILFIMAVILTTVLNIPENILSLINKLSKNLMTTALVAIGLGVHIGEIKEAGVQPIVIGLGSWITVTLVSTILIKLLY